MYPARLNWVLVGGIGGFFGEYDLILSILLKKFDT